MKKLIVVLLSLQIVQGAVMVYTYSKTKEALAVIHGKLNAIEANSKAQIKEQVRSVIIEMLQEFLEDKLKQLKKVEECLQTGNLKCKFEA